MSEDIFDIVNSDDEVVGRAPRSEIHSRGLLHRSAHVLIFSDGGVPEILLQKRSASKDIHPGKFTAACSGHVDSGEDYGEGVLRELREETGIRLDSPSVLDFVGKISPRPETGMEFVAVYAMRAPRDIRLSFSPEEIDGFEWVPVREFEERILESPELFTPSLLCVYGFYLSKRGQVRRRGISFGNLQ